MWGTQLFVVCNVLRKLAPGRTPSPDPPARWMVCSERPSAFSDCGVGSWGLCVEVSKVIYEGRTKRASI